MNEKTRNALMVITPTLLIFLANAVFNPRLLYLPSYYATASIFLLAISFIWYTLDFVEKDGSLGPFFARMLLFIFTTLLLFGMTFHHFSNRIDYLETRNGVVTTFEEALYFSGITLLTIGYGDVVPNGAFRSIALFEGILGVVMIYAFVATGATIIYEVRLQRRRESRKK